MYTVCASVYDLCVCVCVCVRVCVCISLVLYVQCIAATFSGAMEMRCSFICGLQEDAFLLGQWLWEMTF